MSTERTPVHGYAEAGSFTVPLAVGDLQPLVETPAWRWDQPLATSLEYRQLPLPSTVHLRESTKIESLKPVGVMSKRVVVRAVCRLLL